MGRIITVKSVATAAASGRLPAVPGGGGWSEQEKEALYRVIDKTDQRLTRSVEAIDKAVDVLSRIFTESTADSLNPDLLFSGAIELLLHADAIKGRRWDMLPSDTKLELANRIIQAKKLLTATSDPKYKKRLAVAEEVILDDLAGDMNRLALSKFSIVRTFLDNVLKAAQDISAAVSRSVKISSRNPIQESFMIIQQFHAEAVGYITEGEKKIGVSPEDQGIADDLKRRFATAVIALPIIAAELSKSAREVRDLLNSDDNRARCIEAGLKREVGSLMGGRGAKMKRATQMTAQAAGALNQLFKGTTGEVAAEPPRQMTDDREGRSALLAELGVPQAKIDSLVSVTTDDGLLAVLELKDQVGAPERLLKFILAENPDLVTDLGALERELRVGVALVNEAAKLCVLPQEWEESYSGFIRQVGDARQARLMIPETLLSDLVKFLAPSAMALRLNSQLSCEILLYGFIKHGVLHSANTPLSVAEIGANVEARHGNADDLDTLKRELAALAKHGVLQSDGESYGLAANCGNPTLAAILTKVIDFYRGNNVLIR